MTTLNSDVLCNLDDIKMYYGLTGSKPEDDKFIEDLINNVTDLFETHCCLDSFKAANYTEYLDGTGGRYIFPKNIPINSVASIYDDPSWTWTSFYLIDSADYRIVNKRCIVAYEDYWYTGEQNIKITYNAGFTTIPGDLKLICMEEVVRRFKNRTILDLSSKNMPDGTVSFVESGLLKTTKDVLKKYSNERLL